MAAVACALMFVAVMFAPAPTGEEAIVTPPMVDATATADAAATATTAAAPTSEPAVTSTPVPPTLTPTPTPIPVRDVRLSFSGDVLSHSSVYRQAQAYGSESDGPLTYDYAPMFADVQDRLEAADLALCVLETPLSPDNADLSGYPTFNAPQDLADGLKAVGFDGCSTASNHSYDRGARGVAATLDQLDRVGLGHAGMARSADEAASVRTYDLDGLQIAHLSWTYGLNGFVLPSDQPWLVNVTDVEPVLANAAAARSYGADLVILSIQWGNEYVTEPTPSQLELADIFTASPDIDIIVGNHAHVIQPVSLVNDKIVVYGLGNFLSNQSGDCCPARTQDGVMVEIIVSGNEELGWTVDDLVAVPTWVDRSSFTIIPVVSALTSEELSDGLRAELTTSLERTRDALSLLGSDVQLE